MGRNHLYTSQGVISWRFDGQFAVLGDAGGTGGARLNRQRASSILFGAIEGIRSNPETWQKPRGARCPHPFEASILGWNCSCRTTFGGANVRLSLLQGTSRMYRIRRHAPTVLGKATRYAAPKSAPSNCPPNLSPDLLRDYLGFGSLLHLIEPCGRLNRCRRWQHFLDFHSVVSVGAQPPADPVVASST